MSVLQPGEDMRHAALAAAEDGAQVLGVAGGDGSSCGGGWGWPSSMGSLSWLCPSERSTTSLAISR